MHTFMTLLLRPVLIKVLLSTLVYQIEMQGGIALHVYIDLIKLQGEISFPFHENQHAGGNFSSN
jgi:hypothetical protein